MATNEPLESESKHYSVAVIGSSGGGTATLGHTDPVELLTTINRELSRISDVGEGRGGRRRRACAGMSHAIFVCLCDGSGFDSVRREDWVPGDDGGVCGGSNDGGPAAALYSVGFDFDELGSSATLSAGKRRPFRVRLVEEGPLTKINGLARRLDDALGEAIYRCHDRSRNENDASGVRIAAMISLSSEPTTIHSNSLGACGRLDDVDFPIAGSGGTSLSQIASLYDLRIVGNSGGSVASTTLTKARGWAMGLAEEWGMKYDETIEPTTMDSGMSDERAANDLGRNEASKTMPVPTFKSILEAALPTFLFVCISLRWIYTWRKYADEDTACVWDRLDEQNENAPLSFVTYALRHIVIGTTCCILVVTARGSSLSTSSSSGPNDPSGDQSTLLMAATIAGVLTSASASQSIISSPSTGGGGALAGLVAGTCTPLVLAKVSNFCVRHHVTATMTNILCGGGVGTLVGALMHLSGLAHLLGVLTGAIRSLLRLGWLVSPEVGSSPSMPWPVRILGFLQNRWAATISLLPSFFFEPPFLRAREEQCSNQYMPVPLGFGFIHGCIFVYGSKIGWYHSFFLPAILLEMDSAQMGEEASLFGAIDECTLVMVCAGICCGNLILPLCKQKNPIREKARGGISLLSWQALKTNVLCGDFIEAAYPSMERSRMINGAAYIAAGLSSEILLQRRVLSTAYLPLPAAIWISNDSWGMGVACLVAFVVSLCGTLAANAISVSRR